MVFEVWTSATVHTTGSMGFGAVGCIRDPRLVSMMTFTVHTSWSTGFGMVGCIRDPRLASMSTYTILCMEFGTVECKRWIVTLTNLADTAMLEIRVVSGYVNLEHVVTEKEMIRTTIIG